MVDQTEVLLEELSFGPAQGRRSKAVDVEVVRGLRQDDLALIAKPAATPTTQLTRIRHSHHQLAMGLADGLSLQAVSLSSGYDIAYISKLKSDPTFAELIHFYEEQKQQAFVDVMARMRQLGLDVVDELQAQFNEAPDKFSLRDKMELCELMLVKSGHVGKSREAVPGGVAAAPFALNVNFISPPAQERLVEGRVIEGEKV